MTSALLFSCYRPSGKTASVAAILAALCTGFATLATGQHYVIDLLVACPFTGFVWAAVANRKRLAAGLFLIIAASALVIHLAV
jgi:hypothetical protein